MWQVVTISIAAPVLLFLFITWLLRRIFLHLSGWSRLRDRYAASAPASGWPIRGESITVGSVRFRRIARFADAPEGLYLAVGGLAPLPAVMIPWHDLLRARRARFYRRDVVEFSLPESLPALQVSSELHARLRPRLTAPARL